MSFKLRQQIQDVKTVKYIVKNNLPFRIVEDDAFREMILSHNANAKVMSNKKVKNIIITLEPKNEGYCCSFNETTISLPDA